MWQVVFLTISSHCYNISCRRCLWLQTCKNQRVQTDSLKVDKQVQRNLFMHRLVWLEAFQSRGKISCRGQFSYRDKLNPQEQSCSCCQEMTLTSYNPEKRASLKIVSGTAVCRPSHQNTCGCRT